MSIIAAAVVPHPPLIVPEIGRGEERGIDATIEAYRKVMERVAALKPDTIVITSPHTVMYADYFHISPGRGAEGDFSGFRAPEVKLTVPYDEEFRSQLIKNAAARKLSAGTLGEKNPSLDHGSMIPLYFLREHNLDAKYLRVGLSGLSALEHYRLGEEIARTAADLSHRTIVIASGDLSHKLKADGPYGYNAAGPKFDELTMKALGEGDFFGLLSLDATLAENAAECGLRSFWIMAGAFDGCKVAPQKLSYEGPFGVGYGVAWFKNVGSDDSRRFGAKLAAEEEERLKSLREKEDAYVRLARHTLESYVLTGAIPPLPENLPSELLTMRSGAFVSLKKDGHLRGCIGTFLPTQDTLGAEIRQNAVSAGCRDPRFSPVTPDELGKLVYSVDVLTQPEAIASEDQLDPKRYGVIVKADTKRGLLLPDLEGIDTVAQQVAIARQKGGIGPTEQVELFRFTVTRHH